MINQVNLSTELITNHGTLHLDYPVMNASGILCFPPVLRLFAPHLGVVVTKSIGPEPREGYKEPIVAYKSETDILVNAVGLPNPGYQEFRREIGNLEFYPLHSKDGRTPIIISIFANDPEKFAEVARGLHEYCDALELNFGCPNILPGEEIGMIIGQDPDLIYQYTSRVRKITDKPLIAKLTPNVNHIEQIVKAAVEAGADAISAINTISPGEVVDERGRPILTRKQGGISGPTVKERGLETVRQIYSIVSIPIIGMGGIRTPQDVLGYMFAGADAVAIGTAFMGMNTSEIKNYLSGLYQGLSDEISSRGYSSLREMLDAERR